MTDTGKLDPARVAAIVSAVPIKPLAQWTFLERKGDLRMLYWFYEGHEAVVKLQAKGSEIVWGGDFGNTDETLLTDDLDRPVMIDRYPTAVKAFYFQPADDRPEVALGVDFIAPEGFGEIIGGGQRIHSLELLKQRLKEHHLPEEAFNWYLDLRRYGSVPHAGFGMGVERFVAWMCGLEHIRETIAFPRMLYRTRP